MKKQKIDELKELLLAEQATLLAELSPIGFKNTVTGQWEAIPDMSDGQESDENDLADRSENYEERSSLASTLGTRMSEVENALQKITDGVYGICEVSDEEIEEDRLMANPAAKTCIAHMG